MSPSISAPIEYDYTEYDYTNGHRVAGVCDSHRGWVLRVRYELPMKHWYEALAEAQVSPAQVRASRRPRRRVDNDGTCPPPRNSSCNCDR